MPYSTDVVLTVSYYGDMKTPSSEIVKIVITGQCADLEFEPGEGR